VAFPGDKLFDEALLLEDEGYNLLEICLFFDELLPQLTDFGFVFCLLLSMGF
jgi:hypothetical protein